MINNIGHLRCVIKRTTKLRDESFLILCSMKPLAFKNTNVESRWQEVNILRGTVSSVMGLKLAGSDVLPLLCMRIVHAFFYMHRLSPDCQMMRNNSVI